MRRLRYMFIAVIACVSMFIGIVFAQDDTAKGWNRPWTDY